MSDLARTRLLSGFDVPEPTAGSISITNVTIVPMDSERTVPNVSVIIEGGTITKVSAPGEDVSADQVVDGSGMFLSPGLADMHVHFDDPTSFAMFLANGVTRVRNMRGSAATLTLKECVRRRMLPGPHIVTTSPIVDGVNNRGLKAWPDTVLLPSPGDADTLVAKCVDRGYDQIKAYQFLGLEKLRALGSAAARAGVIMTGHCPTGVSYDEAIGAGLRCIEHLTGLENGYLQAGSELPGPDATGNRFGVIGELTAHHLDFEAIRGLGRRLAAAGVWCSPTLVVRQGLEIGLEGIGTEPLAAYETPSMLASWVKLYEGRNEGRPGSATEWRALGHERDAALRRVLKIFHEEGVQLLLGTDTPQPWVFEGFSVHDELNNLVAAGLSPYAALCCGTTAPARFLGQEDTWGEIKAGHSAELLMTEGNPLESVSALREPAAVFVNGYYFPRDRLDRLLESRLSYAQAPVPTEVALPPAKESGTVVHGILSETLLGRQVGRLEFRRTIFANGEWLLEEDWWAPSRDGETRRRSHWSLGSDGELLEGRWQAESRLGVEALTIDRTDTGYTIELRAVDGRLFHVETALEHVLPGQPLAVTVWPLSLASRSSVPDDAVYLTVSAGEICLAESTTFGSADPDTDVGETVRWLEARFFGEAPKYEFRYADGELASIQRASGTDWRLLQRLTGAADGP
ncbi:MAG: amidohydrolase family protein [Acidimicrobiales bacterium]